MPKYILTLLSVKYDFSALEYFCLKQKLDVVILMLEHEKFDKIAHSRVCSHPLSLIYLFERPPNYRLIKALTLALNLPDLQIIGYLAAHGYENEVQEFLFCIILISG